MHGCHLIPEQVDDPENEGGNHQQAEGHFPVGIEEKDGAAAKREEDSMTMRMIQATIWRIASRSPVSLVMRSPVR